MTLIKAVKASDYSSPRYWPTWFGIGLMRLVALMPLPFIVAVGSTLGRMLYWLATQRRQIGEINLRIAFPDYSPNQIRQLNKACFRNVGTALFEIGLCWWEIERLRAMYETEGLEHLKEAERQGKGVIILTAHFTCLEVGGPLLSHHVPFQVMYRRYRNELFDAFMKHYRGVHMKAVVNHHAPIQLIKGLKKGYTTWYAPDQDFGSKDTVFVPFFGVVATALTAPARIAKISGAPVVPYYIQRKPRGRGYKLTFQPPLQDFPSGDAEQDALRINEVIERMILQNPEQYLWIHKRYKNRPEGQRQIYPSEKQWSSA